MNYTPGIVGTSVSQNNIALLEKFTLNRENRIEQLTEIKKALKLDELIYLSTCNRAEFIYIAQPGVSSDYVLNGLLDYFFRGGRDVNFSPNDITFLNGEAAIKHLFMVVSSMKSLVIGETQITDQFKQAYHEATLYGLAGKNLSLLASEALKVTKKIKSQTEIGHGSLSMASLALSHIDELLPDRKNPAIALVGSGEMTGKMARYVFKHYPGSMLFVNRTLENVRKLADKYQSQAMSLEQFLEKPPNFDVIVSSTASPSAIFDTRFLDKLKDFNKPILCIDLAIPRDFIPEFTTSRFIRHVDMVHLRTHSEENLRKKFREVSKAREIINQTVHDYLCYHMEKSLKPILQDSYRESLELAQRALEDLFKKKLTDIEDEDKEKILSLVTKLIGHSTFQPSKKLSDHLVKSRVDVFPPDLSDSIKKQTV